MKKAISEERLLAICDEIPTTEILSINILKTATYQQWHFNIERAKAIAAIWDFKKVGSLQVSLRDGQYWVVDGQHRLAAAVIKKLSSLKCDVMHGLTYEEEAYLFATQNDNRRLLPRLSKFWALVEAKDPEALKIKEAVESAGLEISKNGAAAQNKIVAINTLMIIYKQVGGIGLFRVLNLINKTYNGATQSLEKKMLLGVNIFLKTYGEEADEKIFINQLRKVEPSVIIREGDSDMSTGYSKYAKVILRRYNYGRSKRLPSKFE